jgi:hypothetical protein
MLEQKKIEFPKIIVPKFNMYILVLIFFIAFINIFIISCLTFDLHMIVFPKSCLMDARHIGLIKDVFFPKSSNDYIHIEKWFFWGYVETQHLIASFKPFPMTSKSPNTFSYNFQHWTKMIFMFITTNIGYLSNWLWGSWCI